MVAALLMLVVFSFIVWLVFFKLKLLKFSIAWGVVCALFGAHLMLIFLIGLRFVAPYSSNVHLIQHTIQLIPRLPEPTLITAVLVQADVPVKKGQPLFQLDRRPYEYKVMQLEADLKAAVDRTRANEFNIKQHQADVVAAGQDALVLKANVERAAANVEKVKNEVEYAKYQYQLELRLADEGAGAQEDSQKWFYEWKARQAGQLEAEAEVQRARLKYESQIKGVNTDVLSASARLQESETTLQGANAKVTSLQAELDQARYYLENTTMLAPEDGHIINLQVVPGMVAGTVRFGAIASFIVDKDRYILGNFFQEHLKYVKPGQPVEVALDLFPGQIFKGRVDTIWAGSGAGQLLPSGELPTFNPGPTAVQTGFAVKILLNEKDLAKFPIGAQGAAAIYTSNGGFAALRRIVIRTYSWLNWLYPLQG
jgi:multidrug resistance efflux pump